MSNRWVVDADYPGGHLVSMTSGEQSQLDADQAANATASSAQATLNANRSAILAAIATRMASLRQARAALAAGSIFAAFSVNEKKVIDALLQDDLQLGRLVLDLFDATDA